MHYGEISLEYYVYAVAKEIDDAKRKWAEKESLGITNSRRIVRAIISGRTELVDMLEKEMNYEMAHAVCKLLENLINESLRTVH